MDISSIHFHDTRILRISEDCEADTVTMEVDYPVDWERDIFEKRSLVFDDANSYQVFEGPFQGCPTILETEIVSTKDRWSRLRLTTNAGYRELNCVGVRLIQENEKRA